MTAASHVLLSPRASAIYCELTDDSAAADPHGCAGTDSAFGCAAVSRSRSGRAPAKDDSARMSCCRLPHAVFICFSLRLHTKRSR